MTARVPLLIGGALAAGAILDQIYGVQIAKALDPNDPKDFEIIVATLEGRLSDLAKPAQKQALQAALQALDVDWKGTSAESRRKIFIAANTALRTKGLPIPKMVAAVTTAVGDTAAAAGKSAAKEHGISIEASFDHASESAQAATRHNLGLYVTNNMGQIDDAAAAKARQIVEAGIRNGATNGAIAKQLEAELASYALGRSRAYYTMLAGVHLNRARTRGLLSSFSQAGARFYKFVAVRDEVTTPQCRYLHGKTFPVADAIARMDAVADGEDPKTTTPWIQYGRGDDGGAVLYTKNADGSRNTLASVEQSGYGEIDGEGAFTPKMDSRALVKLGVTIPPCHANCRSTLILHEGPAVMIQVPGQSDPPATADDPFAPGEDDVSFEDGEEAAFNLAPTAIPGATFTPPKPTSPTSPAAPPARSPTRAPYVDAPLVKPVDDAPVRVQVAAPVVVPDFKIPPQAAPKPEPTPAPKPEPKPTPKPEPKPTPKPKPTPAPKPDADDGLVAVPEAGTTPKPDLDTAPKPEREFLIPPEGGVQPLVPVKPPAPTPIRTFAEQQTAAALKTPDKGYLPTNKGMVDVATIKAFEEIPQTSAYIDGNGGDKYPLDNGLSARAVAKREREAVAALQAVPGAFEAMRAYTGNSSAHIRRAELKAAKGEPAHPDLIRMSDILTAAMRNTPPLQVTCYRGVQSLPREAVDYILNSDVVRFGRQDTGATTSSSTNPDKAYRFSDSMRHDNENPEHYKVLYVIRNKTGVYVGKKSYNDDEQEIILRKDATYRKIAVGRPPGTERILIVELEEIT